MTEPTDLTQRFRRLIAQSGPLSVAQFMGEANAEYYAARDPLGSAGDFTTAPEISQMFGEMIGLWCADLWQRAGRPDVAYVELGPGRGTLARDALRAMARLGLAPETHFVEASPALRALQHGAVPNARFHDTLDTLPNDTALLIVANEFFDALPVRQVVRTDRGWRERKVSHDGDRFLFVAGDSVLDGIVPEAFRDAEPGTILEACPAAVGWMREIAARLSLRGGAALVLDYGMLESKAGSTLQAVRRHRKVKPLTAPGTADLTAHVDFAALRIAASTDVRAGVRVATTTQGAFLERLGITSRAQALVRAHPEQALNIAAAHRRLVAPQDMGELFKVMTISVPYWPKPIGFD